MNGVSALPAPLIDQLRDQRTAARTAADEILTRAQGEDRDLTADESRDYTARVTEAREVDDRIEDLLADEIRELRAADARRPDPTAVPREPVLTREQSMADWCRARSGATDEPLSFDRYLRGIATGHWDGADEERALSEGTLGAGGALVPPRCRVASSTWPATPPG